MAPGITKLSLNSLPTDLDFEDYISAHLLLGGYTLDRSIHEKVVGAGEIFEVDIISHMYTNTDEKRLIEIKSKKWDMNEVFKTGGRLRYLRIPTGAFIVQDKIDDKKFSAWQKSTPRMDISLVYAGKKQPADTDLDMTEFLNEFSMAGQVIDKSMLAATRYCYNAERCMRKQIAVLRKQHQKEGIEALWDFSNAIQDISFFDDDPVSRLHETFELFKKYNHISARLDYEYLYGSFPDVNACQAFEDGRVRGYMLNDIDYLPVNYSLYLEHRLRLYILQSCVEYLVMPKIYQNQYDEFLKKLSYGALTSNITQGIDFLATQCPNYRLYPRLWQIFTYMMGGIILTDFWDKERDLLSNVSGVPINELDLAFSVYDILFPTSNKWIRIINGSHLMRLNLFSAPLMGIGANFRRCYYRDDDSEAGSSYEALEKKLSKDYTCLNLLKWNAAAFNLLKDAADLIKS